MPTSLVTGAGGFAGRYLVEELLNAGHAVIGGTLDGEPPEADAPPAAHRRGEVGWTRLDVTEPASLRDVVGRCRPDHVFHLAGQASVSLSFSDVVGTWTTNATGTLLLLEALREAGSGARIVVVSSSEVYGAVPPAEQPIREDRPLAPESPYAASKAAAEVVAGQTSRGSELEVVVARSFNHIGPGQSPAFALANWAAQLASMRRGEAEPVLRVGNLEARRDLLDVRDVVAAYRMLGERGADGAVYNVCSGRAQRLREVVDTMVELSGTGARVEVDPARLRPVDIPLLCGDCGRLRGLGWEPRFVLRDSLAELLEAAATEP